jgi:lysophospholipase L1-like esterase
MILDLVGIGDSLTYGYPYGPGASWLNLAAGTVGLKAENKGINGETTGEMAGRFYQDVISLNPQVTIILGGTNDAWVGATPAEVKENVRIMADLALQAEILPVIALPPPLCRRGSDISVSFLARMAEALQRYRQAYQELAGLRGLKVLDFYPSLLDPDTGWGKRDFFIDDAHPNRKGYRAMAELAVSFFRELGIKSRQL